MSHSEQLVEFRFPACTDRLKELRRVVRETLAQQGCAEDFIESTVLAIDEAAANVLRHGYCGDESQQITLQILKDKDRLVFRLIDSAPPVDPSKIKSRDLDDIRPGGLGVHIIKEVMDSMEYATPEKGKGNVLIMTRKLPG